MAAKTVLVTGANGFVAAHILTVLLDAGYRVVGTVRSRTAAEHVKISHARFVTQTRYHCMMICS